MKLWELWACIALCGCIGIIIAWQFISVSLITVLLGNFVGSIFGVYIGHLVYECHERRKKHLWSSRD